MFIVTEYAALSVHNILLLKKWLRIEYIHQIGWEFNKKDTEYWLTKYT